MNSGCGHGCGCGCGDLIRDLTRRIAYCVALGLRLRLELGLKWGGVGWGVYISNTHLLFRKKKRGGGLLKNIYVVKVGFWKMKCKVYTYSYVRGGFSVVCGLVWFGLSDLG